MFRLPKLKSEQIVGKAASFIKQCLFFVLVFGCLIQLSFVSAAQDGDEDSKAQDRPYTLRSRTIFQLPNPLGVAGPFVGTHGDALIVAGGANFPQPVWESDKQWLDEVHVATTDNGITLQQQPGKLSKAVAYGAAVSTDHGVICIGGNSGEEFFDDVFLIQWNNKDRRVESITLPPLPRSYAYGQAVMIGDAVYFCGGQVDSALSSAENPLLKLDISQLPQVENLRWESLGAFPGPSRAFYLLTAQHNGYEDCIYLTSGRRQGGDPSENGEGEVEFLTDHWCYRPSEDSWERKADIPRCVMAGTSISHGQSHLFVLGGADGSLFTKADELRDQHPGFPKRAWCYHTITDTWTDAGATEINQVTTKAVIWRDEIVIASGEIRPRVRTPNITSIWIESKRRRFGIVNYSVLITYLLLIVGVGVYFTRRNKDTDDYFRGGMHIPWWAAGCSIFATMLSSLTFTGIPSKAYAQDWVYAVGNFMIPVVAFFAVFVALPFYRRLDAASAYEYLEKRFDRNVRWFASASFTLFHLFRMAVVMSLTGLALSVATPLSPAQSVLLMGVLSIVYCVLGGIEAVIWTDTVQTFVLLGGAIVAIIWLIMGTGSGLGEVFEVALQEDKFRLANFHFDITTAQLALWIVVLGSIGQNISSYTADQAVVQRYMTTSTQRKGAQAIWTNALLSIPATILFFGIGTALFLYYRAQPDRLDPTVTTDQVFPLFIAEELPIGLAGLIVAGVFAAAQSTVSTSMNSTATTIITDFVKPLGFCSQASRQLWAARITTLVMGVAGTLLGLLFVDPEIKSLFESFIKVVGLFMGVLGGLFVLGVLTKRATANGAIIGGITGAGSVFSLWQFTDVNGFVYTACGIIVCFVVGYSASMLLGPQTKDLNGLTFATRVQSEDVVA